MKRRIAILGSTGSIGRQTLDVVRQHPDLFQIELLTANNSTELLISQAREFDANSVVICNESHYREVADALHPDGIKVFTGIQSACDLVAGDNIDIVVASMVGFSGLAPTVAAVKAGKVIALANKETLVAAGSVVMDLAEKHHAPILPVDSEHSAIFQCLLAAQGNALSRIHLTASGGPFRTWDRTRIEKATKDMALKHPNWNMGAKITIDSGHRSQMALRRRARPHPCRRAPRVHHPFDGGVRGWRRDRPARASRHARTYPVRHRLP